MKGGNSTRRVRNHPGKRPKWMKLSRHRAGGSRRKKFAKNHPGKRPKLMMLCKPRVDEWDENTTLKPTSTWWRNSQAEEGNWTVQNAGAKCFISWKSIPPKFGKLTLIRKLQTMISHSTMIISGTPPGQNIKTRKLMWSTQEGASIQLLIV